MVDTIVIIGILVIVAFSSLMKAKERKLKELRRMSDESKKRAEKQRQDEERKQREKETYEHCARTLSQEPAFIHGCANWMENQIRERIQRGRAKPMREDETRMRFEFCAGEIYFSNNGKGYLGYYVLHYRDLGYESISDPSALALAYLVSAELQKRLPTIPISVFGGWGIGYENTRRGIHVDISKEVRLLKTLQ